MDTDQRGEGSGEAALGRGLLYTLEVGASVAALVSAVGWSFVLAYCWRLDVYPEEIGASVTFVMVRTLFLVSSSLVAIFFLVIVIFGWERLATPFTTGVHLNPMIFRIAFPTLFAASAIAELTYFFSFRPWAGGFGSAAFVASAVVAVVAPIGVGTLLLAVFDWDTRRKPKNHARRLAGFEVTGLVVLATGVAFCALAVTGGLMLAHRVKDGHRIGTPFFRAPHVQVAVSGEWSTAILSPDSCYSLLGSSDGIFVLYDFADDRSVRVSAENVQLSETTVPC